MQQLYQSRIYIYKPLSTTPDKALTNRNFYYNIHLQQGPITTSDHFPIIATISSNPIQIPIKTRFSYRRANWEGLKDELKHLPIPDLNNKGNQDIDGTINDLYTAIINTREKFVPKIRYRTIPGIKENETIKYLKTILQRYIHQINTQTIPQITIRTYIETLQQLREEMRRTWQQILKIHKISGKA